MASINTVLGPVDSADLGFTLSHEHIVLSAAGMRQTYPEFGADRQSIIDAGVAALKEAYDEGVRTIIDVTTFDLGRDIGVMEAVSRRQCHTVHRQPSGRAPCFLAVASGYGGATVHSGD